VVEVLRVSKSSLTKATGTITFTRQWYHI